MLQNPHRSQPEVRGAASKTWVQGRLARQRGDIETNNTTAHPQQGSLETGITSAPEKCTKNTHFSSAKAMAVSIEAQPEPAKAMTVSVAARPAPAKAMAVSVAARPAPAKATAVSVAAQPAPAKATAVSDKRPSWPIGPGGGTHGWRQDPAGLRANAQAHGSTPGPTGVEGAGGICRGAGGRWRGLAGSREDAPSQTSAHHAPLV